MQLLLQNAKCKMQRSESREREKRVLSPLGLTFRENRVLRHFLVRFSLGVVIPTAGGANGDSEAILWRFLGYPSSPYPDAAESRHS